MRRVLCLAWFAELAAGCLCGGADFASGPAPDAGPDIDCADIPHPPFDWIRMDRPRIHEDLAFDGAGNLVGWRDGTLFASPYDGEPTPVAAGVPTLYGMRYLPDGTLVAADGDNNALVLIDAAGARTVLLSGLQFPNGVAVDMQGQVWLTEFAGNRVRKVDPATGDFTMILDGEIPNPNGLAFDREYRTLYIGGWLEKIIYALPIAKDGTVGAPEPWNSTAPRGLLHGLGVDWCGNVYVSDILEDGSGTIVYRIPEAGGDAEMLFDSAAEGEVSVVVSNFDWGSGIGGWDSDSVYLINDWVSGVYELHIGLRSRRRPFP